MTAFLKRQGVIPRRIEGCAECHRSIFTKQSLWLITDKGYVHLACLFNKGDK